MNALRTVYPSASIFSRPPCCLSTSTTTNATSPPSRFTASIAAMVESPLVTTSSMTTTLSPALKFPSISLVWPWLFRGLSNDEGLNGLGRVLLERAHPRGQSDGIGAHRETADTLDRDFQFPGTLLDEIVNDLSDQRGSFGVQSG